ncbi:hypothetical protein CC78DRAFT_546375 [Lojkania enalia]|uniref:Uncharacterized protein n=1 Tax=Lojkania enalia TaxID=147567 RepID=A0A9P4N1Q2_9PLEO|nr:hypothetical protein CC78DRAFT_546375 [Didymosphaeria enalia]
MGFSRYSLFVLLVASSHALNATSPNSNYQGNLPLKFAPEPFFQALDRNCGFIANQLELIPENPKNSSRDRFTIAQIYSECLASQYGDHFACSEPFESLKFLPVEAFPAMYRTQNNDTDVWMNAKMPFIPSTGNGRELPKLVPIIQDACIFDIETLTDNNCCENGPSNKKPCGKESFNLLACSIQSVRTYVGCTAKQDLNIATCVTETAKRINFVPIGFQVDSNGNTCPKPVSTISHLALVTVVDFFVFLLIDNPTLFIRLFRRFVQGKQISIRTRTFRASHLGFWVTIAKDICENVVLTGIVLQRQNYQIDILKNFVLFSIRPRGAFFHALLGYIDAGWAHDGLIDMVSQILLSVFGGYMALFGAISANHTLDPLRPLWWKTYLAGGVMASIVTDFLLLYLSAILISIALIFCGGLAALALLAMVPAVLGWYMLIVAPFKEVVILLRNVINCILRRARYSDPDALCTFNQTWFKRWYMFCSFISLVLFIGSWMYWNGFLRLSGELYCPQELSRINLVMIGFYAVCVLVRKFLAYFNGGRVIEGEIMTDGEPLALQEFVKIP